MDFKKTIDEIISKEQGYVDHKSDRGGPTNWGITEAVARANGFDGDMRDLPREFAARIYTNRYIIGPKFDQVAAINEKIAMELIDTGVNMGPTKAAMMLQRWLNGLNARGSRFADMFVDGALGPVSLDCLRKYLAWRGKDGETVLFRALNSSQAIRYLEIAEGNQTQEDFLHGWMINRVE